jgi:hypothetical protein
MVKFVRINMNIDRNRTMDNNIIDRFLSCSILYQAK